MAERSGYKRTGYEAITKSTSNSIASSKVNELVIVVERASLARSSRLKGNESTAYSLSVSVPGSGVRKEESSSCESKAVGWHSELEKRQLSL